MRLAVPEGGRQAADRSAPQPTTGHRGDAPAVYGALLVTTLIAVQWRFDASVEFIAFSLVLSVGVFWLTHVWTELVNRRVRGPVDRTDVLAIARGEAPMLATALVPALVLATARLGALSVDIAVGLALSASIAQLFLWGLATGRALDRGWAVALVVAVVDCLLGLAIVGLKVVVIH